MSRRFVSAWPSGSREARRKPTAQQWTAMMPELSQLKRSGYTNSNLLQFLLDEGYDTSLSTLERKLGAFMSPQQQVNNEIHAVILMADIPLNQNSDIHMLELDDITGYGDDGEQISTPHRITEIFFGSAGSIQYDNGQTPGISIDAENSTSMINQSPRVPAHGAPSVAALERTAASVCSGYPRSIQESSDKTVETESNCPSMLATMLQTGKRARRQVDAMKKETLKPKLPPSAPSSGQKVEEWDNDFYLTRRDPLEAFKAWHKEYQAHFEFEI